MSLKLQQQLQQEQPQQQQPWSMPTGPQTAGQKEREEQPATEAPAQVEATAPLQPRRPWNQQPGQRANYSAAGKADPREQKWQKEKWAKEPKKAKEAKEKEAKEAKEKEAKEAKEREAKAEEETKPLSLQDFPTLGIGPTAKKGPKAAPRAPAVQAKHEEAALPPQSAAPAGPAAAKAPEVTSRIAGTAWGKPGGAAKNLKEGAEVKAVAAKSTVKAVPAPTAAGAIAETVGAEAQKASLESAKAEEAARAEAAKEAAAKAEAAEAQQRAEEAEQQRLAEEASKRQEEEAERRQREEEQRRQAEEAAAKEAERRRKDEEDSRRREECERKRKEAEAERRRQAEEEERKRIAEEKKRQEEAAVKKREEEEAEAHKRREEEKHRQEEEALAERKRQEEEERKQEAERQRRQEDEEAEPRRSEDEAEEEMAKAAATASEAEDKAAPEPEAETLKADDEGWDDDDWDTDIKRPATPAPKPKSKPAEPRAMPKRAAMKKREPAKVPEAAIEEATPEESIEQYRPDGDFDRVFAARAALLFFQGLAPAVPEGLRSFCSREDESAFRPAASFDDDRVLSWRNQQKKRDGDRRDERRRGREDDRSERGGGRPSLALPPPSETAYKRAVAQGREEELRRAVQSLLNKICPENVNPIADKIVETKVGNTNELEMVIGLIMKKAHSEPHYCETYADLVYKLKTEMPEFPSPDGGKATSFKSTLLNCCQSEFEAMIEGGEDRDAAEASLDKEEIEFRRKQKKTRTLANMKFIGHLFLRQLLTAKIIGSVIQDLAMCERADSVPAEHIVECMCELLNNIGYTMESLPMGKVPLAQVCGRLMDLKQRKDSSGKQVYSKRIQFQIQDLLDTRSAGWTKKTFKAVAKTKEEIRIEQSRDIKAQAAGRKIEEGEMLIAGARPSYLTAGSSGDSVAWTAVPRGGRA